MMLDLERHRELLRQCSIAAALEAVGERWSFLILRGAFNGLHHFEEFQSTLGIARNILSNRLARLVEHGILARDPDPADRRKVSYRLTEKGRDLLPVLIVAAPMGRAMGFGQAEQPGAGRPLHPPADRADGGARGGRPRADARRAGMDRPGGAAAGRQR